MKLFRLQISIDKGIKTDSDNAVSCMEMLFAQNITYF